MKQTVVGLFNKSSDAQQAVQQLLSNGFTNDNVDVSLSYQNAGDSNAMGSNTMNSNSAKSNTDFDLDNDHNEHESGIARFFKNLFGDDDSNNADRYSKAASRGSSIVTVHAQSADEAERAADILDDYGAEDVDNDSNESAAYSTSNTSGVGAFSETTGINAAPAADTTLAYDATSTGTTGLTSDKDVTNKSIPIIEENLEVGKRTVQTGGVRLRSRIVERPVEEELRLRTERVYVDRNTVNRPATEADFNSFKEGEVELTESAEVPVVNKQARVVEEVSLGKDVDQRTETIRDTVRKTEVDVEDLTNKSTGTTSTSSDTTWRDNS